MHTSGNTIGSVHSTHFGRRTTLGAELSNLDQIQKAKSALVPPIPEFSKKFSTWTPLSLLQWTLTDIHTQPLGSHTLLNVKSVTQLCREKSLQQATNYESQHIEDIDDIPVNAMHGNITNTQAKMELGEESEDTTLQHIVSSQKLLEVSEVTHLHPRKHAQSSQ